LKNEELIDGSIIKGSITFSQLIDDPNTGESKNGLKQSRKIQTAAVTSEQGDQIGRIFASCVVVFFG
jgi:hypothetical protein